MAINNEELCNRFEELYPGAVADTMDQLGYTRQTLPNIIGPLTAEMRVAGIAYPVVGKPDDQVEYDKNIRRILQMLGEAPEHSIVVYETNDDTAAHLGELSTTALRNQGCRGAVIDGGVRDTRYILEQDFPVFTRYNTPTDAPLRWRIDDWGVPIQVSEVEIRPGDVLVGDFDGVVCVPQGIAEEVLERAEEMVETEDEIRNAVMEGQQPLDAYEEHGKF